jgi:hypothetical protein
VETGDAVLGMVIDELPMKPRWLVVRNASGPQINGKLPKKEQVDEAVRTPKKECSGASINEAIAVWGVIYAMP